MCHSMYYRRGRVLGLSVLILIVLASSFSTISPGYASYAAATATLTFPPELPLVLGTTITRRVSSDHPDIHCFDANPDQDVIVTIDSPVLLSISDTLSFVWQNKYGDISKGGGGGGGGGGSTPPDEPTSETLFLPGFRTSEHLPEESVVLSIYRCIWVRRYHRGTTTYRMKAVEVSPQPLPVGQSVSATTANTTYNVSGMDSGLYIVQAADKTGASLTAIQTIGDVPPVFFQRELIVGKPKFVVKLIGKHLMVRGTAPYQVSIERLKIVDVGDTPVAVTLTNDHPAAFLHVESVTTPQIQIEASIVSGSGAVIKLISHLTSHNVLEEFDVTETAKASRAIPNEGARSIYILVMLPNINTPDISRSVIVNIAAKASQ